MKRLTDSLQDMSAATQINAVTSAADDDNHDSDNLVGQDEQRDTEPTLVDDSSETSLDCMPPITPTDLLNDAYFKDTSLILLFWMAVLMGMKKLIIVCCLLESNTLLTRVCFISWPCLANLSCR